MKPIRVTFIDTGGHGYYSVSKHDFAKLGITDKISGYSGHNLTRIFLEEDVDASLFFVECFKQNIKTVVRNSYNLKFKYSHNFNPALFNYRPKTRDKVIIYGKEYYITWVDSKNITVTDDDVKRYKFSMNNIFKYIQAVIK